MNRMKTFFALAACLFVFAACSSSKTEEEQVLEVSQSYIKAFQDFDDAAMNKYCMPGVVKAEDNKDMSAQEQAMLESIKSEVAARVYVCDSVRFADSGTDAVVYVSCKDGEKTRNNKLNLTKTEEGWKVSKGLSVK